MVVLAASILEKGRNGKVLMSRQFVPMTKTRVDSLLQAFPKLLGDDAQHTIVETDTVRYLYQTIEDVNLVLITNKQSDIIEDLDTLRLLARVIPEEIGEVSPTAITNHAFDIIFAFDEVLNMGYKENATLQQIRTFLEMDSHEEKLAKIAAENKKNEARLLAQQRASEIDRKKLEMREQGHGAMEGFGSSQGDHSGFGSSSYESQDNTGYTSSNSYSSAPSAAPATAAVAVAYTNEFASQQASKAAAEEASLRAAAPKKALKGLALGKKAKQSDFMAQIAAQDQISVANPGMAALVPAAALPVAVPVAEPVRAANPLVTVSESVSMQLERDGSCSSVQVQGQAKLAVFDADRARLLLRTTGPSLGVVGSPALWKCQLRPGADKKAWNQGVIALSDTGKAYPLGSDSATVLLRWRYQDTTGASSPLTVTVWATNERGRSNVSAEFNYNPACGVLLQDLTFHIPCPSTVPPHVNAVEGQWRFDAQSQMLHWNLPQVGRSAVRGTDTGVVNGSIEFNVAEVDEDSFAPVLVTFVSHDTLSGMRVTDVVDAGTGEAVEFSCVSELNSEKVVVQ